MIRVSMPSLRVLLLVFGLACGLQSLSAQWGLGLSLGGSTYTGELSPASITDQASAVGFSYGAHVRYEARNWVALRLNYQDLDIFGSDVSRISSASRNLSFYSDLDEIALLAEIYPIGKNWLIAPYAVGGVAAYRFNPITYFEGAAIELQPLGTEGQGLPGFADPYKRTQMSFPLGGGLKVRVKGPWSLAVEGMGRVTFTDYLDDVSTVYVNETTLAGNGPLAVELAFRGDELSGENNSLPAPTGERRGSDGVSDYYYSATVTLMYSLGSGEGNGRNKFGMPRRVKCPKF